MLHIFGAPSLVLQYELAVDRIFSQSIRTLSTGRNSREPGLQERTVLEA